MNKIVSILTNRKFEQIESPFSIQKNTSLSVKRKRKINNSFAIRILVAK